MKIIIKPLFFQGFMGVGLLEIVAKSVIQGSSWLHVGGLGAKMGYLGAKMGQLGAKKAQDPPRGPLRPILNKFW